MKKIISIAAIVAILAVLIIGCTGAQQTIEPTMEKEDKAMEKATGAGKVASVSIKGFKFVPSDLNIKVGDTIVWTNEDSAPHTVESSDGVLKSDELSKGDTYQYKFTKAGKHDYICGIHPSMHGSVTVQ